MPEVTYLLLVACVVASLACAAWSDLATRLIPDPACIIIAVAGVTTRSMAGAVPLAWSLVISMLLFCVLVAAHARGILGGGDVKLIAATTICLSPTESLLFLTTTALSGGILAALHLALRWLPPPARKPRPQSLLRRVTAVERWRIRRHAPLPYGIAIASGGTWALLSKLGN